MSEPFFPNVEEIMTILMAELPQGVYADDRADDPDPNNRSNSSAEIRAHAMLFALLYENLDEINQDKFISTVTPDGLPFWEKELFAAAQDASLTYTQRQQNLLAKRRANGGISLPAINSIVHGILDPVGLNFDIIAWSGQSNGSFTGTWLLGQSALGQGTFLGILDPLIGAGRDPGIVPLDCNLDYAAAGITQQQLTEIQEQAYTYEVKIYGTADANTLALLDRQLTALEPARSTHVITNNATNPTYPSPYDFSNFVSMLFS